MGILTKHLLEPVVPPRKRRPELDIPADVEAVCLRALEKDRDKRWPDMDAFYQALGAAGGVPFEPSNVFVPPQASLRYPQLTEANAKARQSKTAISVSPPSGTFDDERPQRAEAPAGSLSAGAKLGLGVGGGRRRAPRPGAGAARWTPDVRRHCRCARAPAAAPATPAPRAATAQPAVAPSVNPAAAIQAPPPRSRPQRQAHTEPTVAPAETAERAARPHHHHEEAEPKADPLHRKIDVPGEPTPAELKNPFSTP